MHLEVGDRLLVSERDSDQAGRVCRILSVRGTVAAPSYLVLRYDTGHEELLVPSDDLEIRVLTHTPA